MFFEREGCNIRTAGFFGGLPSSHLIVSPFCFDRNRLIWCDEVYVDTQFLWHVIDFKSISLLANSSPRFKLLSSMFFYSLNTTVDWILRAVNAAKEVDSVIHYVLSLQGIDPIMYNTIIHTHKWATDFKTRKAPWYHSTFIKIMDNNLPNTPPPQKKKKKPKKTKQPTYTFENYKAISMAECKKDVTPLLMHWSTSFFVLTDRYDMIQYLYCAVHY